LIYRKGPDRTLTHFVTSINQTRSRWIANQMSPIEHKTRPPSHASRPEDAVRVTKREPMFPSRKSSIRQLDRRPLMNDVEVAEINRASVAVD
jgi:hypothetical protein